MYTFPPTEKSKTKILFAIGFSLYWQISKNYALPCRVSSEVWDEMEDDDPPMLLKMEPRSSPRTGDALRLIVSSIRCLAWLEKIQKYRVPTWSNHVLFCWVSIPQYGLLDSFAFRRIQVLWRENAFTYCLTLSVSIYASTFISFSLSYIHNNENGKVISYLMFSSAGPVICTKRSLAPGATEETKESCSSM